MDRLVQQGDLPIPPYINTSPTAIKIGHWDKGHDWFDQNIVVMEAGFDPDGVFHQRMLVEAVDRMGRIDLRDDRIAYLIRAPDPDEARSIARKIGSFVTRKKKDINRLLPDEKAAFKNFLKDLQQECGITPDGLFGPQTAGCMARESSIIDIHSFTSEIVYPETPRHAVYVVPKDLVDRAPQQYDNGFGSLDAVKQNAVDPKEFAAIATQGTQFVVFVYFFDRVDPYTPLCLRIGPYQKKSSGTAGQQWYAAPGKWPVVVETFTIDTPSKGSLYLNLFIKDGWTRRCISSHRLQ